MITKIWKQISYPSFFSVIDRFLLLKLPWMWCIQPHVIIYYMIIACLSVYLVISRLFPLERNFNVILIVYFVLIAIEFIIYTAWAANTTRRSTEKVFGYISLHRSYFEILSYHLCIFCIFLPSMSLYPILSPVFTGPENSRLVVYARTQQTNILNLIEKNKLSIVIGSSATNVEKCIPLTQFLNIHDQNAKDIIMKFTDGDIDTLNKLQEKYCESLDNAKIIDIAFYSDLSKNLHYWLHFTTIILSWSVFLSWHNIGSANGLINLFTICISVFIMMLLFLLFGLSYRDSAELSFLALLLLSLLTMRYHQNLNKFRDVVDLFVSILPYTAIGFTATTMFIMTEDGWTTFVAVVLTDVILILISPLLKKYFAKSVLIHTINCNHKKSLRIL